MDELNIRGGDMDCTKAARFLPELVFTGTEPSPSDSEFDDPTARFTRGGEDGAAKNEVDEADRPCFGLVRPAEFDLNGLTPDSGFSSFATDPGSNTLRPAVELDALAGICRPGVFGVPVRLSLKPF